MGVDLHFADDVDLRSIASNLELKDDGIWEAREHSATSYPEDGSDFYFGVEDESLWFSHRNQCLLEVLKRFPPHGVFFDIGGGNGCVAAALQNAGLPIVLVEPDPRGARNARLRKIRHVVCSTLDDAGFRPGSLPAVGAFDVVEHIEDDLRFLRSLTRCLAVGGRLYVTVPAYPLLWSQHDDYAGHYRRYTAASLQHVFEQAGFEIEYLTQIFRFLTVPVFLLRTIPYRLGLRRWQSETAQRAEHGALRTSNQIAGALARRELAAIRAGRISRWGSSCLAVARNIGGSRS